MTSEEPVEKERSDSGRQWLLRVAVQCAALLATLALAVALVGVAQRTGWLAATSVTGDASEGAESAVQPQFTCPMHPEIRQDAPGKCPICGMTLVEVAGSKTAAAEPPTAGESDRYICPMMCTPPQGSPGRCPVCAMELVKAPSGPGSGNERSVVIDAATRRIAGIRTAVATRKTVFRSVRAVGEIAYDQQRVSTISAYVDGRIEQMFIDYEGAVVDAGGELAVIYSPQLYSAQVEYLAAQRSPALGGVLGDTDGLRRVAEDNLRELGMTPQQIDGLLTTEKARKRLTITSPQSGTVIARLKVEGDYVKTGDPIYRIADLSTVWLMLELYPSDAAQVRYAQEVDVELSSEPGVIFPGRVAFIDPVVSATTRTVQVRVELFNSDGRFKPGDYATAKLRLPAVPNDTVYDAALAGAWISPRHPQIVREGPGECPLCDTPLVPASDFGYAAKPTANSGSVTVPRSAVLLAGENSVAYVEVNEGEFELRNVVVAALTPTEAALAGGIAEGEVVATDGAFLIDSQMQLAGKPSLIDPLRSDQPAAPAAEEAQHAH